MIWNKNLFLNSDQDELYNNLIKYFDELNETANKLDVKIDFIVTHPYWVYSIDKKNDKLLILSASGNSKNLIKAAKWVKQRSGKVLSLLGFNGGKLKNISNCCVHIKTEKGDYGPVEDIQLIINHVLAHWYQEKINN